jgi:peptidoglycan/LPS O-acetylase OafA/YrhL
MWGNIHLRMPCGGILRGCAGYLTGILLYRLYADKVLFSLPWKVIGNLCLILIPVVVVGINRIAFILPLFALLIYALAHPSNAKHVFWSSRPLIFLGDISYSVYMIQFFILSAFVHSNLHWTYVSSLCCVLFTVVLIIFSYITYSFIEKPSRRYIRKRWLRSEAAAMPVTEQSAVET